MKEKENTVPTSRKKRIIYSIVLAVCALLLIAAIVLTAYFVTNSGREVVENPPIDNNDPPASGDQDPPTSGEQDPPTGGETPPVDDQPTGGETPPVDDKPTDGEKVAFVSPLENVKTCSVEYFKIYENTTLDKWYYHKAVDYSAPAGTEVRAMADGEVISVSMSERLGNLIVVQHENGIQSTYRFVEPVASLKEGDTVKQGEVIAKVAEAYGTEANDGTHLHLEMELNGKSVDPTDYIDVTLEEK